MLELIPNIMSYILQIIIYYYYILSTSQIIKDTKHTFKTKVFIFLCSLFSVLIGTSFKNLFPLNALLTILIIFLFLKYILFMNNSKSAMISIFIFIFLFISEILSVLIFIVIFNKTAPEMMKFPWLSLAIVTVNFTFLFFTILLFNKILIFKQKIINFLHLFNGRYLKIILYLLLFTILPQAILIPLNRYNYEPIFLILNFFQLFLISIFLFWYISNFLEKERIQEQLKTLEMDNKTLGGMVDGVRTIKHDFNNIFQAINGYICSKQYDELEQYILKVMKECNIVNTLSIINTDIFDDPANYGVIGSKYFIATEDNITMDLDSTVSFKEINFPMPELSRILGILLDNAIEATQKCDNKYIRLEIKYIAKKNATVIRILNTYDTSIKIDLNRIFNKGYSSKKIKSGLGLWEVSKMISKHRHSQIYATIENDKFVQNIIIENT